MSASSTRRGRWVRTLLFPSCRRFLWSSSSSFNTDLRFPALRYRHIRAPAQNLQNPCFSSSSSNQHRIWKWSADASNPTFNVSSSAIFIRNLNTIASEGTAKEISLRGETDNEVEPIDFWEEEDETEPEIGDGGDGGGVVLQNCPWGERTLTIAREVLQQFGDDIELFAFKTSPRGYIYVRLDKLSNQFGCPSIEVIEQYNQQYKRRLEEAGAKGEIPDDLGLEVSSPGAERLLKVPEDLNRFKDMAMRVTYVEDLNGRCSEKNGVFFLAAIETESGSCVWKLADVKENREPSSKGRPLSRKQRDWRLKLSYSMFKTVTLYLDY